MQKIVTKNCRTCQCGIMAHCNEIEAHCNWFKDSTCVSFSFWANDFLDAYNSGKGFVIDGRCFTIEDETYYYGNKGNHGKVFIIKTRDGDIIETDNLWNHGDVTWKTPKDYYVNNAEFVHSDSK